MRFASIASGSSGNCIYAGSDRTHVIIDAGISCRRIESGLKDLGLAPQELEGILITHEHSDHIQGLMTFMKKHPVPLYGTEGTLRRLKELLKGFAWEEYLVPIRPDEDLRIGDLTVHPFSISHDAVDPVGYRVASDTKAVAVATDLGFYNSYTVQNLQGLDAVLLESNHDVRMLETGSYPYYLKQRILGPRGHLSNETAGQLLNDILNDRLKHILLGHISKENNYPDLAYQAVCMEINLGENDFKAENFDIQVASRDKMSEIFEV